MLTTAVAKKRLVGVLLLAIILTLFFSFNRFPKLDIVGEDLDAITAPERQCFQGFCIEREAGVSFLSKWTSFSVTYLRLVTVGMTFAFLVAGLAEAFLFPKQSGTSFQSGGIFKRTIRGAAVGPVMNLCSACIVPVSSAFHRRAGLAGAIAMVQGSATMNIPALAMVFFVFTPLLGISRLLLAVIGALLIGPIVVMTVRKEREPTLEIPTLAPEEESDWKTVLNTGFRGWAKASIGYLVRMAPIMVIAGFASGLVIQWLSPETVAAYLGNDVRGVVIAATFGILINVPLLFEIPLVALLLLMGMGTAPAAALLFTAAAGGPVTFWGLAKLMPKRATATFAAATWGLGAFGGLAVLGIGAFAWGEGSDPTISAPPLARRAAVDAQTMPGSTAVLPDRPVSASSATEPAKPLGSIAPFTNIAPAALGKDAFIDNRYPGVAIFDFDRDGDLDFYVTSAEENSVFRETIGGPNKLFRNDGDDRFTEVAQQAGVAIPESNSSGVVACDIDNDGYQDLYVGAYGRIGDGLDYRSVDFSHGLREVVKDRLFRNNGDGTFEDITDKAFGPEVNVRSAGSVACADVDLNGWLDLFIGNRADQDFVRFDNPRHHGHYNALYRNNGDLTFTDVTEDAGLLGPEIVMRDPSGHPIEFEDPNTGTRTEGYDPTLLDKGGNRVGDPTGQTWAVLFFDHDDDGDPDLWLADDGDRLKVYRNDSSPGQIRFTSIGRAMDVDQWGSWMGFALGDYDGDSDLDIFVTNIGFHPLTREVPTQPSGDCAYAHRFDWGTCFHYLLRNDGTEEVPGLGTVGLFRDVAGQTDVERNRLMPPASLDPSNIQADWLAPSGLAAYDFGFGTTFFDYDNDGDQDLYWLGSIIARGEGPGGFLYPGAGRMLRGDGRGSFDDITVEARLLDIQGVDYSILDPDDPEFDPERQRIEPKFHENGKGLAKGDLNGDGYVDLVATNSNGLMFAPTAEGLRVAKGPLFMWMNSGGDRHWITLRLRGRMAGFGAGSNADAVGARVYLKARVGHSAILTQVQDVLASSTFLSMNSLDLNFGLGSATTVDEITIHWPSGVVQILENVGADQLLEVKEPAEAP